MPINVSQKKALTTWAAQQGIADLKQLQPGQMKEAARALDLSVAQVQALREAIISDASQLNEAGAGASKEIGGDLTTAPGAGQRKVGMSPAMVFHSGGKSAAAQEPALSDLGIRFVDGRQGYTEFRDSFNSGGHTIYPALDPAQLDGALQRIGADVPGAPEAYKYDFVRTSTLDVRTFKGADDVAEAAAEKLYRQLGGDLDQATREDAALVVPREPDPSVKGWLFRFRGGMGDGPYELPIVVSYDGSRAAVVQEPAAGKAESSGTATPQVGGVAQDAAGVASTPRTLADLGIEWLRNPRQGYHEFRDPYGGQGHTVYTAAKADALDAALKQTGAPTAGPPDDYKYNLVRISTLDVRTFDGANDVAEAAAGKLYQQLGGDLDSAHRDDTVLLATRADDEIVGWLFGFLGKVGDDVRQLYIAVSYDGQRAQALDDSE